MRREPRSVSEPDEAPIAETRGDGAARRDEATTVEQQVASGHAPKSAEVDRRELGPLRRDRYFFRAIARVYDGRAHLYIGLYYEAAGKAKLAREHIALAVENRVDHYMGDVARVHLQLLK